MNEQSSRLEQLISFRRNLLGVLRFVESEIAVEKQKDQLRLETVIFARIKVSA